MKIRCLLVIFVLFFVCCSSSVAEINSLDVGYGTFIKAPNHWIKEEPRKKLIKLELSTEKGSFHLGEPITIKFRIKNLSDNVQDIDFSNISICGYDKTFKKEIFFKRSIEDLSAKLKLKKDEFLIKEVALDRLYKVNRPDTLILWAYYNLPDDKGINSNDLEITITP